MAHFQDSGKPTGQSAGVARLPHCQYNSARMGYTKLDGRPQGGARSEMLQVRIGTVERDDLKDVCSLEGVSVSEFVRQAIANQVQLAIADFIARNPGNTWGEMRRGRADPQQGLAGSLPVKDMTDTNDIRSFYPPRTSAGIKMPPSP